MTLQLQISTNQGCHFPQIYTHTSTTPIDELGIYSKDSGAAGWEPGWLVRQPRTSGRWTACRGILLRRKRNAALKKLGTDYRINPHCPIQIIFAARRPSKLRSNNYESYTVERPKIRVWHVHICTIGKTPRAQALVVYLADMFAGPKLFASLRFSRLRLR